MVVYQVLDTIFLDKRSFVIRDAFLFFEKAIRERFNSDIYGSDLGEYLVGLRQKVMDINYVHIESTSDEDSYTIFEILNARGQELQDYELLKNYIMRYIQPTKSRDKAKERWEKIEKRLGNNFKRFLQHYTIHRFGSDRKLTDYKIITSHTKKTEVNDLFEDLMLKSTLYMKFCNPTIGEGIGECTPKEYDVFLYFKNNRMFQMRPVLLTLANQQLKRTITKEEYLELVDYLYGFFICYKVIGKENSNKLTSVLSSYAKSIEDSNQPKSEINRFITSLKNKAPTLDYFVNAFSSIGWSHHDNLLNNEKDKQIVQIVLECYERHINNNNWCSDFTIEHVLSDSNGKNNAIIGNLIPLEKKLNARCIDIDNQDDLDEQQKVLEKCKIYRDSNFKTTRNFASRYGREQKKFDILHRTKLIGESFYKELLRIPPAFELQE